MRYEIKKIGDEKVDGKEKYADMGMVQVVSSFYLEPGDEGYEEYMTEHYVLMPIIPQNAKYTGAVDLFGFPLDWNDYNSWIDSFPKAWQKNPFCTHAIQFEPDVTEADIASRFDSAIIQTHKNYLVHDLHCKIPSSGAIRVNPSIDYRNRKKKYFDISRIPPGEQTPEQMACMKKVKDAKDKVKELNDKRIG